MVLSLGKLCRLGLTLAALVSAGSLFGAAATSQSPVPVSGEEVKAAFLHAWNGYKQYAWGHDGLKPLSKVPFDWYSTTLLMTPIDALDTMLIMGHTAEAAEAKALIFGTFSDFDRDIDVQHFEIAIRLLGGLVASYQLDGDPQLLALAVDLAGRMLPVFDSPTGMPYRFINLHTGKVSGTESNPAEIGTYLLEYGALSQLTGDPRYYDKAKRAMKALHALRSPRDLVGSLVDVESGAWIDRTSSIGGGSDSYFEYMLKAWLLFGDTEMKEMWESSIKAINAHLADELSGALWYGRADMQSGRRTQSHYGALDAFFPALLALGGDAQRARRLLDSSYRMWQLYGIEPEMMDYRTMSVIDGAYLLRPEIIESAYYMYQYTKDQSYRAMGYRFFRDVMEHCQTPVAFSALSDVRNMRKSDMMESFFLAETLKYFYLLFTDQPQINLDNVIFTTEAHPLRRLPRGM